MEDMLIMKRDGSVVPYDSSYIKNAVKKAVRSINAKVEESTIDQLVLDINKEVEMRFKDLYPNVENIQDLVEKYLIKHNLYEVAKEYILYRAERQKAREEEKKQTAEKSALGKLTVKKRDGTVVMYDSQRVTQTLTRSSQGYEKEVSLTAISKEMIKNIYDGVTTAEIEKALILAAVAFIERDPAYSKVAARLYMQRIYKDVIGKSITQDLLGISYRETFVDNIKLGVKEGIYDKKLAEYDLDKLSWSLQIDRDDSFEYMGIQTLYERYFAKHNKKQIELPQAFFMRVAMGLAINEEDKDAKAIEFYNLLSSFRFMSSSPTLFHSGTSYQQLSSCYLTTVPDDLPAIFKSYSDNAMLSKWAGGLGNDWSPIRATGSWIKTTKVESQGVIPFLKIANDVTAAINRSGRRRGATCAYLETWHLDIEEFLDLRKNTGDDRRRTHDMNTANWIPDLFMKRLASDDNWTLFSPDEVPELHDIYGLEFEKKYTEYEKLAEEGKIKRHKTVAAKKLWRKMISMIFETGHPWMTFKDPCNIRSPQDHVGVVHSSNLCTEITLNTSADEVAVCNLGSINLAKHVNLETMKLDEKLLEKTIKTAVRMLDNVIDINYYPIPEAKNSNLRHRPIGMGMMGLQDAFFMLDLPFDSQAALEFSDKTMELISYHAILTSSELAKEKGAYESYKGSKWDRGIFPIDSLKLLERERGDKFPYSKEESLDWTKVRAHVKEYGMRNSNVMAIAPTASISTIVGCLPCIEPIYKNIYVKANISGEFTVVNSYLIKDLKEHNLWSEEMLDQLKYADGNISMIAGIPEKIRNKYKETFEIDSSVLIKHTALRGKWIDQSQSHNVFIKGTSGSAISQAYQYAWKMGLKTTYYLRTLGATQIEKSTLDAKKFGFTQNRDFSKPEAKSEATTQNAPAATAQKEVVSKVPTAASQTPAPSVQAPPEPSPPKPNGQVKLCKLEDPDCEACQ